MPELSYVEAGRTLSYLLLFAAGVAVARLAPRARPRSCSAACSLAAVAAVAYALASRVWPATLADNELSNRIGAPFQYWNAVGTTAALAVPGLLWLGSRRTGSPLGRALAYPAMGVCILGDPAHAVARRARRRGDRRDRRGSCSCPLRLRSLPVLLAPAAAAGPVGSLGAVAGRLLEDAPAAGGEGERGRGLRPARSC